MSNGLTLRTLGDRLRERRVLSGLALTDLAARSGVSRSMVSEVERGTKTPTVLVLDRLATALGTSIARLLDDPVDRTVTVLRRAQQQVVDTESGWERRILSPVVAGVEFEFMRTVLPRDVDAGEFAPHAPGSREYIAVETGSLTLTVDDRVLVLARGDSAFYEGDCRHAFANHGRGSCVYYLAMSLDGGHPSHDVAPPRSGRSGRSA